jgi:prevent-host-death family protein
MTTVSVYEAKTQLSGLLDRVQRLHEEVVICRHGKATARLVPIERGRRSTVHKALRGLVIKCDPVSPTESEWEHA